jgi:hypothetical protein
MFKVSIFIMNIGFRFCKIKLFVFIPKEKYSYDIFIFKMTYIMFIPLVERR